jgi:hypothetical protein
MQLEFKPKSEIELLREEMKELRESLHKQRRALFARHGELAKMYVNLSHEFEVLKASICQNGKKNAEIMQKWPNFSKNIQKLNVFEQFELFDFQQVGN